MAVALAVLLTGTACGAQQGTEPETAADLPATVTTANGTPESDPASPTASDATAPESAQQGTTAESQRVTFVPQSVVLPGGESARVFPAKTVDGELKVPENVDHVGWWDGSSFIGDPFGSTVIAGHVDSATEGLGYFARLLTIDVGERISVEDDENSRVYRVTSVRTVTKQALAASSGALDQQGDHRLVLITCSGAYRPGTGYDSNLIVTAEPVE